jgi:hypothetical protein
MRTNEFLDTVFRGTSEMDREVIFLRVYSSYSFPDIASILGLSVTVARKRYRRAVNKVLKNVLDATRVPDISLEEILQLESNEESDFISSPVRSQANLAETQIGDDG